MPYLGYKKDTVKHLVALFGSGKPDIFTLCWTEFVPHDASLFKSEPLTCLRCLTLCFQDNILW